MGPLTSIARVNADAAFATNGADGAAKNDPSKVAHAANQFEALLIGQILKSAHGAGSEGWLGAGDDDETSSTAIQMAEEYLGQALASGGGLGIAKLVTQGLDKNNPKPASSALQTMNLHPPHTGSLPE